MPASDDIARTQTALQTLEDDRAKIRALFLPDPVDRTGSQTGAFPRSRILRWLWSHPLVRSHGFALLVRALPIGWLIGKALFRGKARRQSL